MDCANKFDVLARGKSEGDKKVMVVEGAEVGGGVSLREGCEGVGVGGLNDVVFQCERFRRVGEAEGGSEVGEGEESICFLHLGD